MRRCRDLIASHTSGILLHISTSVESTQGRRYISEVHKYIRTIDVCSPPLRVEEWRCNGNVIIREVREKGDRITSRPGKKNNNIVVVS